MHRSTLILGALLLVAIVLIVADSDEVAPPPPAAVPAPATLPEGHPATDGEPVRAGPLDPTGAPVVAPPDEPAGVPLREGPGTGEVREVIPSASFTILRVDRDGEELWIAGPVVRVEVGDVVAWDSSSLVYDFPSATAGRTFELLHFTDGLRVSGTR